MKWWSLLILLFLFTSCSGGRGMGGIKCMKTKSRKVQKYRVKKMKRVYQPVYASTGGSSSEELKELPPEDLSAESRDSTTAVTASHQTLDEMKVQTTSKEVIPTETAQEEQKEKIEKVSTSTIPKADVKTELQPVANPILKAQENIEIAKTNEIKTSEDDYSQSEKIELLIDESETVSTSVEKEEKKEVPAYKLATKPSTINLKEDKPQIILAFREQQINISQGYSFNEIIPFVINRDKLLHPDEAYQQIEDLSTLLKENPQVHVTIIANTATDEPHPSHRYGGDEETLSTMWEQNNSSEKIEGFNSLKELMIGRSKKIEELLIEKGVDATQLDHQLGTHNMWKYQRFVTFILNEKE